MTISIIVAVSENNVIGKNNALPWHLPADMNYFRDTTMGHCVIMGRRNYDSIPLKYRPLDGRTNIIVTRQKDFKAEGCFAVNSLEDALKVAATPSISPSQRNYGLHIPSKGDKGGLEVFIIGGADIYRQTIDIADKIYITHIHHSFEGDAFFPNVDEKKWKLTKQTDMQPDDKNKFPFSFCIYEKRRDR